MDRVICDASSLISLLESCLFSILAGLKKDSGIEFVIPKGVEDELISTPRGIKKFEFSALRAQKALGEGVFTVYSGDLSGGIGKIERIANTAFSFERKYLKVLQRGELEALALTKALDCRNLLVDEKTTRLLIESPEDIRERLEKKLRRKIVMDASKIQEMRKEFGHLNIFRSAELVAYAFRKGLVKDIAQDSEGLRAALYKLRSGGCSISDPEIEEYPSLVF